MSDRHAIVRAGQSPNDVEASKEAQAPPLRLAPVGDDVVVDLRPLLDEGSPSHRAHVEWFREHRVSMSDLSELVWNPNSDHRDRDRTDHHPDGDRIQRFFFVKGHEREENFVRCIAILVVTRARAQRILPEVVVISAYPYPRRVGGRT